MFTILSAFAPQFFIRTLLQRGDIAVRLPQGGRLQRLRIWWWLRWLSFLCVLPIEFESRFERGEVRDIGVQSFLEKGPKIIPCNVFLRTQFLTLCARDTPPHYVLVVLLLRLLDVTVLYQLTFCIEWVHYLLLTAVKSVCQPFSHEILCHLESPPDRRKTYHYYENLAIILHFLLSIYLFFSKSL